MNTEHVIEPPDAEGCICPQDFVHRDCPVHHQYRTMTTQPNPGEIATALVTAELAGRIDETVMTVGLTRENLMAVLGAMTATVGNMVKLIAVQWEVEPSEAWDIIQQARRETGAP